jgi:hypothetical protein
MSAKAYAFSGNDVSLAPALLCAAAEPSAALCGAKTDYGRQE